VQGLLTVVHASCLMFCGVVCVGTALCPCLFTSLAFNNRVDSPHLHSTVVDSPHFHSVVVVSPRLHSVVVDSPRLHSTVLNSPRLN
jgi:hypothetical protein